MPPALLRATARPSTRSNVATTKRLTLYGDASHKYLPISRHVGRNLIGESGSGRSRLFEKIEIRTRIQNSEFAQSTIEDGTLTMRLPTAVAIPRHKRRHVPI